jgi:signal transduction histidine kinase/HAMP domain-containing protein/ActR/RegA family two-component response regulator
MSRKHLKIQSRLMYSLSGTIVLLIGLALYLQASLQQVAARQEEVRALLAFQAALERTLHMASDPEAAREFRKTFDNLPPSSNAFALSRRNDIVANSPSLIAPELRGAIQKDLARLAQWEMNESRSRIILMWMAVCLVVFITFLIQRVMAHSIVRPLDDLGEVVRRMQAGDLTVRAKLSSGDEIQTLSEAFNRMADSIQHNQGELENKNKALSNLNQTLEQRVAEKTQAVRGAWTSAESDRAKLQAVLQNMPDGLILLDWAGSVISVNTAALNILGHTNLDSVQDWVREKPGAFSFRYLNQQIAPLDDFPFRRASRGESFSNFVLHVRCPNNQTRLISFSGSPVLHDETRQVRLALLIFRDVTEELALHKELEGKNLQLAEASRLKDEFLATLSHELRTPLTPIISCAQILKGEHLPSDGKLIEIIERNAKALSGMIDELLNLSAVMNRKLRLQKEMVELNTWIQDTMDNLRPVWEKKGLTVSFHPPLQPVAIEIDPARMTQVLVNLLNNAIKFTPKGGQINLKVVVTGDQAQISVSDTGVGLTQFEIDRIFQIFHQGRTSDTYSPHGLGIGLSVAKSLTELHGGGLKVESEGPDKGSTFTIWLPLPASEVAFTGNRSSAGSNGRFDTSLLRGRRILLVEDSIDTLEALSRILRRRECQIITAQNGNDGHVMALREQPEIIISDVGLPGIDGLEMMRKIRKEPGMGDLISISLSGFGQEQNIKEALAAGYNAHLLKPIEIALLDETLVRLLQSKTAPTL